MQQPCSRCRLLISGNKDLRFYRFFDTPVESKSVSGEQEAGSSFAFSAPVRFDYPSDARVPIVPETCGGADVRSAIAHPHPSYRNGGLPIKVPDETTDLTSECNWPAANGDVRKCPSCSGVLWLDRAPINESLRHGLFDESPRDGREGQMISKSVRNGAGNEKEGPIATGSMEQPADEPHMSENVLSIANFIFTALDTNKAPDNLLDIASDEYEYIHRDAIDMRSDVANTTFHRPFLLDLLTVQLPECLYHRVASDGKESSSSPCSINCGEGTGNCSRVSTTGDAEYSVSDRPSEPVCSHNARPLLPASSDILRFVKIQILLAIIRYGALELEKRRTKIGHLHGKWPSWTAPNQQEILATFSCGRHSTASSAADCRRREIQGGGVATVEWSSLSAIQDPSSRNCNVKLVNVMARTKSLILTGRYRKYSRILSQSVWMIGPVRKLCFSVEEAIGLPMQALFDASGYKFMGAGREDADVRMLQCGRPFALELYNCTVTPTKLRRSLEYAAKICEATGIDPNTDNRSSGVVNDISESINRRSCETFEGRPFSPCGSPLDCIKRLTRNLNPASKRILPVCPFSLAVDAVRTVDAQWAPTAEGEGCRKKRRIRTTIGILNPVVKGSLAQMFFPDKRSLNYECQKVLQDSERNTREADEHSATSLSPCTPAVDVVGLRACGDSKAVRLALQFGAEEKVKTYEAVVFSFVSVSPTLVKALYALFEEHGELTVQQRTPFRVLHRRAQATRSKKVLFVGIRFLHPQLFICRIQAQAGTYIKEFVSGDFGRTAPSLSSLLDAPLDVLLLDVVGLHL